MRPAPKVILIRIPAQLRQRREGMFDDHARDPAFIAIRNSVARVECLRGQNSFAMYKRNGCRLRGGGA